MWISPVISVPFEIQKHLLKLQVGDRTRLCPAPLLWPWPEDTEQFEVHKALTLSTPTASSPVLGCQILGLGEGLFQLIMIEHPAGSSQLLPAVMALPWSKCQQGFLRWTLSHCRKDRVVYSWMTIPIQEGNSCFYCSIKNAEHLDPINKYYFSDCSCICTPKPLEFWHLYFYFSFQYRTVIKLNKIKCTVKENCICACTGAGFQLSTCKYSIWKFLKHERDFLFLLLYLKQSNGIV